MRERCGRALCHHCSQQCQEGFNYLMWLTQWLQQSATAAVAIRTDGKRIEVVEKDEADA